MILMKLLQIVVDKEPARVYLISRMLALDIFEC